MDSRGAGAVDVEQSALELKSKGHDPEWQLWVKGGSYGGYSTTSDHHPKADVMKRAPRSLVGQENMSDVRFGRPHLRLKQSTICLPKPSADLPSHVHLY